MSRKLATVLVAILALYFGMNPVRFTNRVWYLLYHTPSVVFSTVRVPPPAPHTLKASILNVTADFNELSHIIHDFLHSPGVDPSVESAFREFLAQRATRSHPTIENALDWLLAIYKFAFPFLIISLLAKVSGSEEGGAAATAAGNYGAAAAGAGSIPAYRGANTNPPKFRMLEDGMGRQAGSAPSSRGRSSASMQSL